MVTVKISIKKHLEEYLLGKFNDCREGTVILPDQVDLYHVLFDLASRRPVSCPLDDGTLEIALPDRRIGKDPAYYNYLSERSQRILERRVEVMFWAELHDLIDYNKHMYGIEYAESVFSFMRKYDITSITEDALLKNYYRWRDKVRRRDKKRAYNKC
ncbi:MAG: hypothetical protein LUH63_18535 [Parabacteroides sp.]|nr:hypothetical protein [Parabacteroides sp.]